MNYEQYAYTKYNREVKKLSGPIRGKVVDVQDLCQVGSPIEVIPNSSISARRNI